MRRAGKFALWVLVVCLLLFGGYFLYQKWWGTPGVDSVIGSVKSAALEKISAAGTFIKEKTGKTFEKAATNSYSYVRKGTGSAVTSLGDGLASLGERIAGEGNPPISVFSTSTLSVISPTASSSQFATGTGFFIPPPFFAISAKENEPVSFSLNQKGGYTIAWGDGGTENISVSENQTKVVLHSWVRRGDYEMYVIFSDAGRREEQTFFVRIND